MPVILTNGHDAWKEWRLEVTCGGFYIIRKRVIFLVYKLFRGLRLETIFFKRWVLGIVVNCWLLLWKL